MIWSKDCIPIGYFILAIALPNYTGAKLSIFCNIAKHSCLYFSPYHNYCVLLHAKNALAAHALIFLIQILSIWFNMMAQRYTFYSPEPNFLAVISSASLNFPSLSLGIYREIHFPLHPSPFLWNSQCLSAFTEVKGCRQPFTTLHHPSPRTLLGVKGG